MAKNLYIELDLEKPEKTYIDLTPYFQGRVGDSMSEVYIWLKRNGLPFDLTAYNVGFHGVDPSGTMYNSVGSARYDRPGASRIAGKVCYSFPAGMFKVDGLWDPEFTYFYIDDGAGTRISTIGCAINVLPNQVIMGVDADFAKNEIDQIVVDLRNWANEKKDDIDSLETRINAMGGTVKSLETMINTWQSMLNTKQVPTKSEMEDYLDSKLQSQDWGQDLNLCLNAGTTYNITSGSVSNNPAKTAGTLVVSGRLNSLVQVFYDTKNQAWHRVQVSGAWSDWVLNTDFA